MQIIFCFGISQLCLISIVATAVPRVRSLLDYVIALGIYMHALDDVVHSGLRSGNTLKILAISYLVIFDAAFVSCLCEFLGKQSKSIFLFLTGVSKLFLFTSLNCSKERLFTLLFKYAGT